MRNPKFHNARSHNFKSAGYNTMLKIVKDAIWFYVCMSLLQYYVIWSTFDTWNYNKSGTVKDYVNKI